MIAADAEFARTAADGAKENAQKLGFKVVYDRSYPPGTTDFAPIVRAVQAANADIVFVASYPPDTVGIVRSANEIGLTAEDVRRHHDRPACDAAEGAARTADQQARHHGKLRDGADLQLPGPRRCACANIARKRRASRSIHSATALCRSAMPPAKFWRKAVTETKGLDHDKIAKYIQPTSSRPSRENSPSARTANGRAAHRLHAIPGRATE